MKNFFEENKRIVIIAMGILLLALVALMWQKSKKHENEEVSAPILKEEVASKKETTPETESFYVEVKGAVNKPGVFQVNQNNIINDVILLADGFKDNAYTDNINLSYKVSDAMVIYVYTTSEYKKNNSSNTSKEETCKCPTYTIEKCIEDKSSIITPSEADSSNTTTPSESSDANSEESIPKGKININTASLKELTNLSGIGEAKAQKIIDYRTQNGGFKTIEEIKKVNGIGDAIYAKIKDSITV